MPLTLAVDNDFPAEPRIAEGDPLPPEDHAPAPRRHAVDRLYREQAAKLRRFFSRRLGRSDADDLTNDSFVRVIAAPAIQDGLVTNPEGFLHAVAKNEMRNRARAAYHRTIVVLDPDLDCQPDTADPIAALEARDLLARIDASLANLPVKTRQIFMAHRLEGATYAELAQAHGLTVRGVAWHMTQATAHIHRFAGKR